MSQASHAPFSQARMRASFRAPGAYWFSVSRPMKSPLFVTTTGGSEAYALHALYMLYGEPNWL
jgi:hypothetical protein